MTRFLKKENYTVSSELSFSKIKLIVLLLLFFYGFTEAGMANQTKNIDSLVILLQNTKSDNRKSEIMLSIAKAYYPADLNKSMQFAEQARIAFVNFKNDHGVGESTNLIGAGYFAQGNYRKAETLFCSALISARKSSDSVLSVKILNNLANTKLNTGQLEDAIDFYTQAEKIFIQTSNMPGAISIESNLASIFRTIGSYAKAQKHLLNALDLAEEEQDLRLLASVYHNLGSLLTEMNNYPEALDAALKAYDLFMEEQNIGQSIQVLITLGSIYFETDKSNESDTCYRRALNLAEKFGYVEEEAYTLMHLGYLKLIVHDHNNASQLLRNSLELAQQINDQELELQLYDYLYYIDSIQGNFQAALRHFQESSVLKANLTLSETDSKLKDLEKLLNLSMEENRIKENTIKKNHTIIFSLVIVILLIVFITIAIIQHLSLRSQRKIADLTQENLRSQMNPHFIFNVLNSIHTFMLHNDLASSSNYLIKFSHLLRQTLDNSINKLVPIQDEVKALELYLELESMRMENKLEYKINIDDEIDPIMFKIPTLLLQPYIENSVIHGLQNLKGTGKIEINLNYSDNNILCSITDNGIGRKKAEEIKVRNGIKRKSHGTKITETRIQLLNKIYGKKIGIQYHDILDEDKVCKGTCVEFNLPILN